MVNFIALSSSFIVFTSQLLLPANAHVKLYYAPNNLPIRNAASTTTDGAFSTAGACGGRDTWGPLKNAVPGVVGSVVCGRINYNGGHQPDNNNAFRAVWACDTAATKQTTQTALQAKTPMTLETGTSPAANIDATKTKVSAITGNVVTEGYTLCIKIPTQGLDSTTLLNAPERQCTLSILDQRNWGGCIDFVVSNDDGTLPAGIATQSPTAPKTTATSAASSSTLVVPKAAEGTYRSPQQCAQSGGKCCPYAYIALKGETRYASVRLLGLDASCNDMFSASKGTGARGFNYQIVLEPHKLEADALVGYVDVSLGGGTETQKLEIYVRDPTTNGISVTNISPTSPLISDFTASPFKTLSEGIGQQMVYEPTGPYGTDFLAIIIIAGILFVYIVVGLIIGKARYGTWKHIHSDACANICTKAGGKIGKQTTALKSAGGKTLPEGPLPPGWREAKDKEGDIYYYHKETNRTQWERPTA